MILLLKSSKRIPGILVAVVGATAVVGAFDLAARAGLSVLGPLPQGLPAFAIPWISSTDVVPVLIGGVAVALVSFADTSVLSRAYAARTGRYVDPNQEMVGLGAANLAAGFFQGFPISSSSSRTPVAEAAGAQTQLTGIVGALAVAVLLVAAPNLLQDLPTTALAAVVIASAIGLIEITDLIRIYRIQRWEFWLSIVCFVGVAVFGAIPGIGVAVVIAVIEFLWDGWRPHSAVLGRAEGVEGYHDITRYPSPPGARSGHFSLGCTAILCQRRTVQRAGAKGSGEFAYSGTLGGGCGGTGHQRRCNGGRCPRRVASGLKRPRHRAALCRTEGSGEGQTSAVRALGAARGRMFFPHRRSSRRQLSSDLDSEDRGGLIRA